MLVREACCAVTGQVRKGGWLGFPFAELTCTTLYLMFCFTSVCHVEWEMLPAGVTAGGKSCELSSSGGSRMFLSLAKVLSIEIQSSPIQLLSVFL